MSDPTSTQQPYPSQGYPPQGQAPAPKKKHTVRNVILILLGLAILFFAGCMALVGGAVNEVDKAMKAEQANDKPAEVTEGKSFTHDGYEAENGWKVAKESFGGVTIKGLRVTNTADEARTAFLTFRLYKGNENLAEIECSSNQLESGEVSRMSCVSSAERFPKGYDTIKVADFW